MGLNMSRNQLEAFEPSSKRSNATRNVRMQWSKYLSIGPQYAPAGARKRSRWRLKLVNGEPREPRERPRLDL